MKKYATLLKLYVRTSLMIDLEYRANFVGAVVMTLFEVIWSFAATLLFFDYTTDLGGWTFYEVLIVVGLLFVAFGFLDTVVWANVAALSQHVRKGTLDFILTKPVNSQFHVTLQRIRLDRSASMLGGAALIGYGLSQQRVTPDLGGWLAFFLLVIGALVMMYATLTIMGTLSFWVTETHVMFEVVYALLEMGRVPAAALPEPMRVILTFVIPIAFVTTIPAEVILNRATADLVFFGWLFALAWLAVSIWFWKFALRRYGSASS
jgi:ABC-2 type transport system permease protein